MLVKNAFIRQVEANGKEKSHIELSKNLFVESLLICNLT